MAGQNAEAVEVTEVEAPEETSLQEDIAAAADQFEEVTHEEGEETAQETAQEEIPEEAAADTTEPAATEQPPVKEHDAPVDWSPTLKDAWKDLPPEVRNAITNRERHISTTLQQTTESRKIADHFVKTVEPYRAVMAAEGATDPFTAINGLMNTAAQLSMGNPQQKADRIAGLIKHYGVDIQTLDSVLAGEEQQPQQAPGDPRIEQMWNQMQQAQQQQGQQVEYDANQSIQQFGTDPKNEFFGAVRHQMADFLDVAIAQNRQMSLPEAYDRACAMNPEIAAIHAKRRAQEQTGTQDNLMQGKLNAASSISGKQGSGLSGVDTKDMSMRELIASQFGDDSRI